MKITRKELRRLIAEAYRTGVPYRSAIQQSDAKISHQFPQFADKITSADPKQREALKLALDLDRPTPDVILRAIDNPRNGLTQNQINDLVDAYFKENTFYSSGTCRSLEIAEYIFKYQRARLRPSAIDTLYPKKNGIKIPDDEAIAEVIRRYEKAVDRPKHIELGHIVLV